MNHRLPNDRQARRVEAPRFAPDARSRHHVSLPKGNRAVATPSPDTGARKSGTTDLFAFLAPDPIATLRQRMQRNARWRMLFGTWLPLGAAAFALVVFAVQMLRVAM